MKKVSMIIGMVLIGCGTTFSQELSLNQAKKHAKENNKRIKQANEAELFSECICRSFLV